MQAEPIRKCQGISLLHGHSSSMSLFRQTELHTYQNHLEYNICKMFSHLNHPKYFPDKQIINLKYNGQHLFRFWFVSCFWARNQKIRLFSCPLPIILFNCTPQLKRQVLQWAPSILGPTQTLWAPHPQYHNILQSVSYCGKVVEPLLSLGLLQCSPRKSKDGRATFSAQRGTGSTGSFLGLALHGLPLLVWSPQPHQLKKRTSTSGVCHAFAVLL